MNPSTLLHLLCLALPVLALPPIRTHTTSYLPPDLYANPDPFFAGAPLVLSDVPSTSSPTASLGPGRYGISYTPYTPSGDCKPYPAIYADMTRAARAGFTAVRLHATDCNSVAAAGLAALHLDLRLVLGIHVGAAGPAAPAVADQLASVLSFMTVAEGPGSERERRRRGAVVDAVVVGNEAVFNGFATAAEMAALAGEVRRRLAGAGYGGPVGVAEPFATWVEHKGELCGASDVVAASLLPFFHPDVRAWDAGEFVAGQMRELEGLCAAEGEGQVRTPVLAMEVGWPSRGSANGEAVPGGVEQKVAIMQMSEAIGAKAVFASFGDEVWREAGDFGVETHWGCIDVFE